MSAAAAAGPAARLARTPSKPVIVSGCPQSQRASPGGPLPSCSTTPSRTSEGRPGSAIRKRGCATPATAGTAARVRPQATPSPFHARGQLDEARRNLSSVFQEEDERKGQEVSPARALPRQPPHSPRRAVRRL